MVVVSARPAAVDRAGVVEVVAAGLSPVVVLVVEDGDGGGADVDVLEGAVEDVDDVEIEVVDGEVRGALVEVVLELEVDVEVEVVLEVVDEELTRAPAMLTLSMVRSPSTRPVTRNLNSKSPPMKSLMS